MMNKELLHNFSTEPKVIMEMDKLAMPAKESRDSVFSGFVKAISWDRNHPLDCILETENGQQYLLRPIREFFPLNFYINDKVVVTGKIYESNVYGRKILQFLDMNLEKNYAFKRKITAA